MRESWDNMGDNEEIHDLKVVNPIDYDGNTNHRFQLVVPKKRKNKQSYKMKLIKGIYNTKFKVIKYC